MKLLYTTLLTLAAIPFGAYAEDTVGAKNTEGYYVAHLPYTESFDNLAETMTPLPCSVSTKQHNH